MLASALRQQLPKEADRFTEFPTEIPLRAIAVGVRGVPVLA
jgi:hypothetical protein